MRSILNMLRLHLLLILFTFFRLILFLVHVQRERKLRQGNLTLIQRIPRFPSAEQIAP